MTYCVAMRLRDGMVFASDSRTNAGVDHISTFRKMHVFEAEDRYLVLLSAGNLATSQSVVSLLRQAGDAATADSLLTAANLFEVASRVGSTLRQVVAHNSGQQAGSKSVDFGASFIVGGQIRGEAQRLFLVYAEGNFIEATESTPYFQIGESKYGKPIIDRIVRFDTPLAQAVQCTLISFDSTLRSNLSVGLPIDLMTLKPDVLQPAQTLQVKEDDDYFRALSRRWGDGLREVFATLPLLPF